MMRKRLSHKGDNGVVLVIGGSEEYAGAPYLATRAVASLRTGPDLVMLACPRKVAWAVNSMSPDLITVKLRGKHLNLRHKPKLLKLAERSDVVLIGPGMGRKDSSKQLVKQLAKEIDKPKVVDADAIRALEITEVTNTVFTPHQNEFKDLLENSCLEQKNYRRKLKDNIILLKGETDKIISKDKVKNSRTGNEGMTVGGTGDVLAGLVAGLIAQKMKPFDAAYRAAQINGLIGDRLRKELGYGFIASDFLTEIARLNHD